MSELRISILEILEQDSRTTPHEMAMQLGTTEKSVRDEIAAMEQEGIILKYNPIINSEKVDHDKRVLALIEVRVTPQRDLGFEGVAERIYRFEEVHSVYLMSGGYDIMVLMEGESLREVALFVAQKLSSIDGVISTATHFVLKKYKDQGVIFGQKKEDLRLKVTP